MLLENELQGFVMSVHHLRALHIRWEKTWELSILMDKAVWLYTQAHD